MLNVTGRSFYTGNAVLAHDNKFIRWMAKDGALYFNDIALMESTYDQLFSGDELILPLRLKARENFLANFQWADILHQYEKLLMKFCHDS